MTAPDLILIREGVGAPSFVLDTLLNCSAAKNPPVMGITGALALGAECVIPVGDVNDTGETSLPGWTGSNALSFSPLFLLRSLLLPLLCLLPLLLILLLLLLPLLLIVQQLSRTKQVPSKGDRSVVCAQIQFWARSACFTDKKARLGPTNKTCSSKFLMNERYDTLISKV